MAGLLGACQCGFVSPVATIQSGLPCGSKASWQWYLQHISAVDFCVIGMGFCVAGVITELLRDFGLRLSITQNCKNQFAYVNNLML